MKAATAALDGLDKLQENDGKDEVVDDAGKEDEEEADEEIISIGAMKAEDVSKKGKREADIERIRGKALLRRAKARSEQGGWASLQGAEEGIFLLCCSLFKDATNMLKDYKVLSQMKTLPAADKKLAQRQLVQLPARTKAAQEKEMGEMMGKLKQVSSFMPKTIAIFTLDSWGMEF